ncbi:MAG: hypothetical protein EOP38_10240 [Rubrivivax sp.]|nr:MAG: hypothetical protein EOP38_10240 [Rubrivivax sp.]
MTTPHLPRRLGLHIATVLILLLALVSAPAWALDITIDGVHITDLPNSALDTDGPNNNTITFNSAAGGAAGFAIPGYTVSGTVNLGAGGALGALGASIVNLTKFTATRIAVPGGGPAGPLVIEFGHDFAGPGGAQFAADRIAGSTTHAGAVNIQWQGFVNGVAIAPPAGPKVLAFGAPAGGVNVDPVNGAHGVMGVPPPAGPPWRLKGALTVSLGAVGDVLALPNSAEVAVGPIDEPSGQALLAVGVMLVIAVRFTGASASRRSWP